MTISEQQEKSASAPVVSILICTRNRAADLRQTLAALASVDVPREMPAELVVVDNDSTDNTAQVVQEAVLPRLIAVRCVREPERGLSRARNRALAEARGQVLLWTDDDVRFPADWIAGMCGPILRGEADAVAGGIRIAPHLLKDWMTRLHRAGFASTESHGPGEDGAMIGANMAFAKAVLTKVPGFNPLLGAGGAEGGEEDALFSHQVERAGYRLLRRGDVAVEHHFEEERLRSEPFLRSATAWGRGQAYVSYHWYHEDVTYPHLRLAKCLLRRALLRTAVRRQPGARDYPTEQELELEKDIGFVRQYLTQRKRPRQYDKHGLIRKEHR